jgi:hypothetical protein
LEVAKMEAANGNGELGTRYERYSREYLATSIALTCVASMAASIGEAHRQTRDEGSGADGGSVFRRKLVKKSSRNKLGGIRNAVGSRHIRCSIGAASVRGSWREEKYQQNRKSAQHRDGSAEIMASSRLVSIDASRTRLASYLNSEALETRSAVRRSVNRHLLMSCINACGNVEMAIVAKS